MNRGELIQMARFRASQYEHPPELVCAIIEQESGWNPWAVRYEPAFRKKLIEPLAASGAMKHFGASSETEAVMRSTSYGLMQILGETAREEGCEIPFLTELCDPDRGLEAGCAHLAKISRDKSGAPLSLEKLLLAWNGGGDPAYPTKVLGRLPNYLPKS